MNSGIRENFEIAGGDNMQMKFGRTLALLLVCLVLVITASCQKKSVAIDTGTNSTGQSRLDCTGHCNASDEWL